MSRDKDWGMVMKLDVIADTFTALKAALTIALTEHNTAVGWATVQIIDNDGVATPGEHLVLYWTTPANSAYEFNKFLSTSSDAETLAAQAQVWLKSAIAPKDPYLGGDGSSKKGFRVWIPVYSPDGPDLYKSKIDISNVLAIVSVAHTYYGK